MQMPLEPAHAVAAVVLMLIHAPAASLAQPAPTFRATCEGLRKAIEDHRLDGYDLVTIEVVGALTTARFDGALAYLGMCEPPHPRVLCVTYELGERKIGDRAVVTGSYIPRGPDHVQLDPCLAHVPD